MRKPRLLGAAICARLAAQSHALEIHVTVTGVDDTGGRIGCASRNAATDFAMRRGAPDVIWRQAPGRNAVRVVENPAPGTLAISVAHDLNGGGRTGGNGIGLTTEECGGSRDARLLMRAPRFAEAALNTAQGPVAITVEVA